VKKPKIKMVSFGEGPTKGRAFKFAQRLLKKNLPGTVKVVDLQKPRYKLPSNMGYVKGNVLAETEKIESASVPAVIADFFIHHVPYGKDVTNLADIRKRAAIAGQTFSEIQRTLPGYINEVKRILVPGGKFLLTTFEHRYIDREIIPLLRNAGFKVIAREFKPTEIEASGSKYAQREYAKGKKVIKIIAQKPR